MIELIMEIGKEGRTLFTRGLNSLDNAFGKPEKSELIIFYGASSSGKTEFCYFTARKNADIGNKVLYITLELSELDMKKRRARKKACIKKIDYQNLNYSNEQETIMKNEWKDLQNMKNLTIVDSEEKNLKDIEKLMRTYYNIGYRMFIIDNLDKIRPEKGENENQRYQRITTSLQDLKNESRFCILLVHHSNKPDKSIIGRTGIAGMRGSQKIMDNATQVFEIYRELDPDATEEDKKMVDIIQHKDTFDGDNKSITVFFEKGEYINKTQKEKKDLPF